MLGAFVPLPVFAAKLAGAPSGAVMSADGTAMSDS
jgi:hypothetical protein